MFNTNANIFSSEQLLPNNCVFEMRILNTQNSCSENILSCKAQFTLNIYIHIFTEECSHTGIEETFNLKIHFLFEVFKKSE